MNIMELIKSFVNLIYAPENPDEEDTTSNRTYILIFVLIALMIVVVLYLGNNG